MDKILLITLIVCFAINIVVVLALHLSKRKRGGNADEGRLFGEIETLNDNLNEVKNLVNEHTSKEKDSIISSFEGANRTLIQMLEMYMNSFKQTLDDNLNTTKEQLNEIREEMRLATRQMSANTTDALEKMQDKTEKSLLNLKDDTGKSLDKMNDEIKNSLKDMREDNRVQLLGVKQDNEKQLEKMRETVDEKLSGTLDKRIQSAFEIVNDRLDKVQRGFGEMQDLSTKVTNLNKMFANVKTRGGWGEVALESLLDQILSPEQYGKQFRLSKNSQEAVDFVIVMPGQGDEKVYLPIDSKFPLDRYIRLVEASEEGDSEKIEGGEKISCRRGKKRSEKHFSKVYQGSQDYELCRDVCPHRGTVCGNSQRQRFDKPVAKRLFRYRLRTYDYYRAFEQFASGIYDAQNTKEKRRYCQGT